MPSAKSRAAKAATAARVAAYNVAAAATLEADKAGIEKLMGITGRAPDFEGLDTVGDGALGAAHSSVLFKPTLPSMLNLNTSPKMSRALAVGAVMMGAGHNGNPSDEENVKPIVPGTAAPGRNFAQKGEEKGVDGVGHAARPLSPILGNIDNEKGVRACEFERQKVKRAGDLAKRKAAKTAKMGHGHGGRVASEGSGGKEVKSRIGPNDMDVDIAELLDEKPVKKTASRVDKDMAGNGRVEVSLSELVLRQKKARKVKEDDFEMISPVRPVIALDDLEAREMEMEEPWEHVERESEQGRDEPSYAAVVLGIGTGL